MVGSRLIYFDSNVKSGLINGEVKSIHSVLENFGYLWEITRVNVYDN